MCAPAIVAAATIASGAYSAYSQYQQGVSESKMAQYNAEVARQEGANALKRGETQAGLIQDSAKDEGKRQAQGAAQLSASQKAALAANGIDLSSVSAQDIVLDTSNKSNMDEIAIRHNADLESWSATENAKNQNWQSQVTATQYDTAAKNAKKAGKVNAFGTLLGTATQVAGIKGLSNPFAAKSQSSILGYSTAQYR